ncbi:group I truncated hemoglobin [Sphingobium boeckii]|uniref:Hemoglobin n=1 Tax=Sphingobium boeckii TaxID=1082345 RepID=A0A7W9AIP1_9SPHN|nr:group 1 truncated hemoglobin [Sphingobium boeckii]MBB5686378.1 hemoglobin [Sphingobium boeckii]
MFLLLLASAQVSMTVPAGEEPVEPYVIQDSNAGATPYKTDRWFKAFHGQPGIDRIVESFMDRNIADPVIGEIFKNQDDVRIRRTLKEQICYLLGGGCAYTGRDMKGAHQNMGVQTADFNALVENLQWAMREEGIAFAAQNKLLAKLAPMKRDVVER